MSDNSRVEYWLCEVLYENNYVGNWQEWALHRTSTEDSARAFAKTYTHSTVFRCNVYKCTEIREKIDVDN